MLLQMHLLYAVLLVNKFYHFIFCVRQRFVKVILSKLYKKIRLRQKIQTCDYENGIPHFLKVTFYKKYYCH